MSIWQKNLAIKKSKALNKLIFLNQVTYYHVNKIVCSIQHFIPQIPTVPECVRQKAPTLVCSTDLLPNAGPKASTCDQMLC